MRTIIALLALLSAPSFAAMTQCTVPIASIDTANPPKVVYVDQNIDALKNCQNVGNDTLNNLLTAIGGSTANVGLSSVGNIKANIDRDSNTTGSLFWVANHTADTLFRVKDDSSARVFGDLVVDSGATMRGPSFVEYSNPGGTTNLRISNTSTAASSEARLSLITASSAAGDPFIRFDVTGATAWATGVDNSVSGDPYVIAASGALGSSNALSITTAGNATVTGSLTADSLISAKFYEEGTFTVTLTGVDVSGNTTGTARYIRIGKQVTLMLPYLFGTSNSVACTITGMPVSIRPSRVVSFRAPVIDNGNVADGGLYGFEIQTSGVLVLFYGNNPNGFTASGFKGLPASLGGLTPYAEYRAWGYTLQ